MIVATPVSIDRCCSGYRTLDRQTPRLGANMSADPAILMDFHSDLAQLARERLLTAGYQIDLSEKPETTIMKFLNVAKHRIAPKPRNVLISKEFSCPPALQAGVDEVLRKAARGDDLSPHQSSGYFDPDFNDPLLNDWDIHHFHLETRPHPRNGQLVRRTGSLLFARVADEVLYCINVFDHQSFAWQRMLGILHRNWPESIARFRANGIAGETLTDSNILTLRRSNCNTILAVEDGTAYFSPSGGCSSSRTSIIVMRECARARAYCRNMEKVVSNWLWDYVRQSVAEGKEILRSYQFRLVLRNDSFVAIESQAHIAIKLPAL